MTRRLLWHVGTPKSGTTYIQAVLRANRARLAQAGWLVVGETHLDLVRSGMIVRDEPAVASLPLRAQQSWDRMVDQIRDWDGDGAILSYELFAGASEDQIRAAAARFQGIDVEVIVTARELGAVVPSGWQERLKFGLTTPLSQWEPRPESAGPGAQWSWRTLDAASVADRWLTAVESPDRMHIITVPTSGGRDALWERFAQACSLSVPGLELDPVAINESLSPARAEVLRRVNARVAEKFPSARESSVWLRDLLAHRILARGGEEKPGLAEAQFDKIAERGRAMIATVGAAGYSIHGSLDELTPQRPVGREPGEIPDSEVADVAVEAIGSLLLELRERSAAARAATPENPEDPAEVPQGLLAQVRRRGAAWLLARLDTRVAALEQEVQAGRRLHQRVAELDDLVAELLLPIEDMDADVVRERLNDYRRQSL